MKTLGDSNRWIQTRTLIHFQGQPLWSSPCWVHLDNGKTEGVLRGCSLVSNTATPSSKSWLVNCWTLPLVSICPGIKELLTMATESSSSLSPAQLNCSIPSWGLWMTQWSSVGGQVWGREAARVALNEYGKATKWRRRCCTSNRNVKQTYTHCIGRAK